MDRSTKRPTRPGRGQLAFHASRIIIDLGVMIAMAAMSMPFVTTEGADRSSVAADALPVILLLAPIFLITLIPDHSRPVPTPLGWLSLILGIAAFPYAIVKYLDAETLADTLGGSVGTGARLLVLGTFVTLAGIAVGLARNLLKLPQGGTYPARPRSGRRVNRTTDGAKPKSRPQPAARPPASGRPQGPSTATPPGPARPTGPDSPDGGQPGDRRE